MMRKCSTKNAGAREQGLRLMKGQSEEANRDILRVEGEDTVNRMVPMVVHTGHLLLSLHICISTNAL